MPRAAASLTRRAATTQQNKQQLRLHAAGIVLGLTGGPDGVARLKQRLPTLLPASTRGSMRWSNSALTTPCF